MVRKKKIPRPPDTTECFLDSARIRSLLFHMGTEVETADRVKSFYTSRQNRTAWFNSAGLNEFAGNFVNMLNNEERIGWGDTVQETAKPEVLYRTLLGEKTAGCGDTSLLRLEVLLTRHFFEYANRNWEGAGIDISNQVGWFIERKEIDPGQLLQDFLSGTEQSGAKEPVYHQYTLLKQQLRRYLEIEKSGGWPLPGELKIKKGDTAEEVRILKTVLYLHQDLAANDSGTVFDDTVESALRQFQERHGLNPTGAINEQTLEAMRVPVEERVKQLLINMERCRWVPLETTGDYVLVNIPEFKMYVYTNDRPEWSCNVIVGKSNPVNKTIIFNDSIEFIVFSPYWNIPKNILTLEVLPALKKDRSYLRRNNMEVVDRNGKPILHDLQWERYTDHFPYIIRERPGSNNSLGKVKFLFPNPYEIYLHDTPAKALFGKSTRTFSHGCIRIQEPFRFAQTLLRYDTTWTDERIEAAMNGRREMFVKLRKKVPVFIAYFTTWVDESGKLHFRNDVYGHDEKMKQLLFVN